MAIPPQAHRIKKGKAMIPAVLLPFALMITLSITVSLMALINMGLWHR
jgi:hypothetical protein